MNRRLILFAVLTWGICSISYAQTVRDSVSIHFRQSKVDIEPNFMGNQKALDEAELRIRSYQSPDSTLKLTGVEVIGGASPEGGVKLNEWLSRQRAIRIFDYLGRSINLPDSITSFTFLGCDWAGLRRTVLDDSKVPYRNEVLQILEEIISGNVSGEKEYTGNLAKLKRLRKGEPYLYLYHKLFPLLRESKLMLTFERPHIEIPQIDTVYIGCTPDTVVVYDTVYIDRTICPPCRPFYMGLKTNILYDILAVPNIGVEFYVGKDFSIYANWMYGWWNNDRKHRYWRVCGGDITARWWFGNAAKEKPLTGHHIGIYAGVITYDFEWGGTGYMGGAPGGSLWDRCNYSAGAEYGYSLPITRRLNIDFNVAFGYAGGEYIKYNPIDGHYVWRSKHKRHYIGPTKLEVSLVWLIGCNNFNRKKGGDR